MQIQYLSNVEFSDYLKFMLKKMHTVVTHHGGSNIAVINIRHQTLKRNMINYQHTSQDQGYQPCTLAHCRYPSQHYLRGGGRERREGGGGVSNKKRLKRKQQQIDTIVECPNAVW